MKAWWLPIAGATMFAINPSGQSALDERMRTPARPDPNDTAGPARTAQGVLIETSSSLGSGIGAELMGDYREAVMFLTRAIEEEHDAHVVNNVAWFRATCPEARFRNGKEAVELATRACTLENWKDADGIDTLAAAYAEIGNFAEAERYQQKAMALLSEDEALRPKFRERLAQYRAKQPVRQEISR